MRPALTRLLFAATLGLTIASAACSSSSLAQQNWTPVATSRPAATPTPGSAAVPTPTTAGTAAPAAPSTPSADLKPSNGLVQSSDAGSVTIDIKWDGVIGGRLGFDVSMNTHVVSLDGYDLGKSSVLSDDTGQEYRPTSWNVPLGGHHRSGKLAFPVPDSLVQGKAKYVEITVRGTAGGDRVFKWDL